jgi:hypothetical protein
MKLGASMPKPGRIFALASLALHLQASFVLAALSVAVLDDGRLVVESAGNHVVRWHGATPAGYGRSTNAGSRALCAAGEGLPHHRHLSTGECAPAPKRVEFEFGALPFASLGEWRRQSTAELVPNETHVSAPPAGRFAAAESDFGRVVLIV